MVVVDSRRVPRVPRYSGACREPHRFRVRGYHPLWPAFPDSSASSSVCHSPALNRTGPTTPLDPKTQRFGLIRVRSPLLTESLFCFLFLQVLRWFTSLSWLPSTYLIRPRDPSLSVKGVAPFGNPRINACLQLPRGLSQLTTSFIAFRRLGIHRMLLVA